MVDRLLGHSLASQTRHSSNGSILFTSTSGVVANKGQLPLSGPVDVAGKVDDAQVDEELCDLADGHCLLPWDADLERREGVVEVCIVARRRRRSIRTRQDDALGIRSLLPHLCGHTHTSKRGQSGSV